MCRYLNVTIGEKEFDEIKQGKVKILCLPCIPRWCHTLIDGVKIEGEPNQIKVKMINGEPHIQYGRSIYHIFKKNDYVQLFCRVGSQTRVLSMDCAGFSIETTQTKKGNVFIEYKPKNFVVHLK